MSRQQWGAHKAIAGTMRACERVHEDCEEAIRRLEAVVTVTDFNAVCEWIKSRNWFLRTREDDERMHGAWDAARARAISNATARG